MPREDETRQLFRMQKNRREDLVVSKKVFNNVDLVDLRVYANTEEGEVPTRKGICLQPHVWREILPLLEEALALEECKPGEGSG